MKPGDLVGERFRIGEAPIAQGRSGVIWPATDEGTGRAVTVEVAHRAEGALERFTASASHGARLDHPHIVRVIGVWTTDAGAVLVADRFDGTALSARDVGMDPRATIALGRQIASALVAAHAIGIVHGDVRPGNVLIGARGAALFDFGTAVLGATADRRPAETAPEVLAGGPCSERADLYGLGLVLFRALTGRDAHRPGQPPRRSPDLRGPTGLIALIRALLDPDPTRRPASARATLVALDALGAAPHRVPSWRPSGFAPLRPGRAWIVHGVDPATGAAAVFAAGQSRRDARSLVDHLRERGWSVEASREALGWAELFAVLGAAMLASTVFIALAAPAAVLAAWILSRPCRPELRDALPPARTPIPPRELPPFGEHLVAIGLLLLVTAALLSAWPVAAVVPALLATGLIAIVGTSRAFDPRDASAVARIEMRLGEARQAAAAAPDLDAELARIGAIEAIEVDWRTGAPPDRVLARLDALEREEPPR